MAGEHLKRDRPQRKLKLPTGMTLDMLLGANPDAPLPNIAGFDRLYQDSDPMNLRRLCMWADSQETCDIVIKWHGHEGLNRVLRGIAKACAVQRVHMSPRIRSIASFYEMAVY